MGRDREEDISDLSALRMGVRVDRKGVLRMDYQTAQNILAANGKAKVNVQSWRYFLSDAAFLVGLEGPQELLEAIHHSLLNPRYVLYLGRKGYVPSPPPYLGDGLRDERLEDALRKYPYLVPREPEEDLLLVVEANQGRLVYDQPIAPFAVRRFGARYVMETLIPKEEVRLSPERSEEVEDVDQQTGA